jgi:hypothetical protein
MDRHKSKLVRHLELQAQRLRLDAEAARLFIGTTDIGAVAEKAVRQFLGGALPARYSVAVGEVTAADGRQPERVDQTQQKDVLIYDPFAGGALGWGTSGLGLFPVESIYGVMEVKTTVTSGESLLKAVDQALEVQKLCRAHAHSEQQIPFTGVFAFESTVAGDKLFEVLKSRSLDERVDFVLVLHPKGDADLTQSLYLAHWWYHEVGRGQINFVRAHQVAGARQKLQPGHAVQLTFAMSEHALLWLYLFLIQELEAIQLPRPGDWIWRYSEAVADSLGYVINE